MIERDEVARILRSRAASYWRDSETLAAMPDDIDAPAYRIIATELRTVADSLLAGTTATDPATGTGG